MRPCCPTPSSLPYARWAAYAMAVASFFLAFPPPPGSTLFPYTTLFRSSRRGGGEEREQARANGPSLHSGRRGRSEEHTSELQSRLHLVCRLLLEKKKMGESAKAGWSKEYFRGN